jgi:hypothetical protein
MRVIAIVRFYLELRLTTSAVMPPKGWHFFGKRRYIPSLRHAMNSPRPASLLKFGCDLGKRR